MDVDDPAAEADDAPRLTVLGATVQHAIDHVEVFPAPDHVAEVRIGTEELASRCPVTSQPDLSSVEITYVPDRWCVESKSLKLYLWSFRDRAVFAEDMAAEIAAEIFTTAACASVEVRLTQRPRGGITIGVTAVRSR
jgi:7-cyano-7-deazaguanine reductase